MYGLEAIINLKLKNNESRVSEVEYYKSFLTKIYEPYMKNDFNMILWNELKKHREHKVSIVSYGDLDNLTDIFLECEDCNEVVLDAEL